MTVLLRALSGTLTSMSKVLLLFIESGCNGVLFALMKLSRGVTTWDVVNMDECD